MGSFSAQRYKVSESMLKRNVNKEEFTSVAMLGLKQNWKQQEVITAFDSY